MEYIEDTLIDLSFKLHEIYTPNCVWGGVDPYLEWVKWLSYVPDFEKKKIDELNLKKPCDLSIDELKILNDYKENERISKLFKIYGTAKITKEEYVEVYKYMRDESIEDLMVSKLSKEELLSAKEQIKSVDEISDKELNNKVVNEIKEDNYKKLSMVDAYILHYISMTNFLRSFNILDDSIQHLIKENDNMQYRSMQQASKFICR